MLLLEVMVFLLEFVVFVSKTLKLVLTDFEFLLKAVASFFELMNFSLVP